MSPWRRPGPGASSWNSAIATSAAAPPPTPLNSATICGIAVIFTRRAPTAPNVLPIAAAITISHVMWTVSFSSVATIATTMPTAPIQFPRRAVAGDDRKRSASTKHTIVTRYNRLTAFVPISRPSPSIGRAPLLEHLEHAVGDDEAADDVRGRKCDRQEADDADQRVLVFAAGDDHRADDHDAVDRVRARHQRRVQHRRHLRDHLEAEEDREHEHGHLGDERRGVAHAATPFRVTHVPATTSSSQSSETSPSITSRPSSDATFRDSSWLACVGIVDGTFVVPTIVTPSASISRPGSVSSQLPPVSAARSTITEPRRIPRTASAVTSVGAGRPGIAAVVITTSN